MRNEVHDDANVRGAGAARRIPRRKHAVIGAAGLAVLGAGAFLVTDRVTADDRTEVRDTAALAPVAPASVSAEPAPAPPASASAAVKPTASAVAKPTPSAAPSRSLTPEERVAKARATASKAGHPVRRPLVQTKGDAGAAGPVTVRNTGSLQQGGTLRIVSARHDLTGQREQGWAADDGTKVGGARCTQNIRLSNDTKARERPTMLVCWRTSAGKSVVTVAVVKSGRPASATSVAAIDKEWAALG